MWYQGKKTNEAKIKKQLIEKEKKKSEKIEEENKEQKRDFKRAIGLAITELRNNKKMTIEQLAERVDVEPEYLKKCENGEIDITILNILDFCIVFDKSITQILNSIGFSFTLNRDIKSINI